MKLRIYLHEVSPSAAQTGGPRSRVLAATDDLSLIRTIVLGLQLNRNLEDDASDTLLDAGLCGAFGGIIAELDRDIREEALRRLVLSWPDAYGETDDDG